MTQSVQGECSPRRSVEIAATVPDVDLLMVSARRPKTALSAAVQR
jgi:hypothetical protein